MDLFFLRKIPSTLPSYSQAPEDPDTFTDLQYGCTAKQSCTCFLEKKGGIKSSKKTTQKTHLREVVVCKPSCNFTLFFSMFFGVEVTQVSNWTNGPGIEMNKNQPFVPARGGGRFFVRAQPRKIWGWISR